MRSACLLLCFVFSAAHAGNAPQWLHSLSVMPIPAHEANADAVLLRSETELIVAGPGKMKQIERRAYRILRPGGSQRGVVSRSYDSQSRITSMHAWCIPAAGKDYELNDRDVVDSSLDNIDNGILVSDVRLKSLRIPQSVPGSVIGYEVEQELHPYVMVDQWSFQQPDPVADARYVLQLPAGWGYSATWQNHSQVSPTAADARRVEWRLADVAAVPIEKRMPPWRGLAGQMVLSLIPSSGQDAGIQSWSDLSAWYEGLAQNRREASPDIKQKVAALTASSRDTLGKIRDLARFVQTDIRYVGVELGIGGWQPHSAADVFAHRYGDCKDKATLLTTMLDQIGIGSYMLVINTERGSVTAASTPSLDFDHAIVAIVLPAEVEDPSLLAVIRHPKLGRLLIFDPTDEYTPLGTLSGMLQASVALLVERDGGELIETPQLPPDSNSIARVGRLVLDDQGILRGDVNEVYKGDVASRQRAMLRNTAQATDQIKPVEALAAASLSSFFISKASITNLRASDKPFEWHYSLEATHYAKAAGDLLLIRPRVLDSRASGLLDTREPRRQAIEFEGPARYEDVFEIVLPDYYHLDELPRPVDLDAGFMTYHSKTDFSGHTLRYTRSFEIRILSAPVDQVEKLKGFYHSIVEDERSVVVFSVVR